MMEFNSIDVFFEVKGCKIKLNFIFQEKDNSITQPKREVVENVNLLWKDSFE